MVGVQQWAEIRRMAEVEGLSQRAINRRTGLHRKTIARALASEGPPSYSRPPKGSKLDPFKDDVNRLLGADPEIPSMRIRELITELGYEGSKTICDDYVREVRLLHAPPRTFQRTSYAPGELCQFDLFEPCSGVPVGWGQTRRGWLVTAALGYSRAIAAALIFSKTAPDILWGMRRCLESFGAVPETLVWDREAAIHKGGGQPADAFAAFCGALPAGWIILDQGDCQAKGLLERAHRFIRSSFEPARAFATELDYQDQLDRWVTGRANPRKHQGIRAIPAERLLEERASMRALPARMPSTAERFTLRVPPQPYFRFDRNDYSLDPRLVGRRVEIRAAQRAICAVSLDSGEIVASHRRVFAGGLTFTDPVHQAALDQLRGERKGRGQEPAVEIRPLARYDELIPA
ncbi:MAG: IS21 family transposase [Gemmatimonadetes bacterium]|nr:IS21 family transposase [Gemmatimonadota bacterium]